MIKRNTTQLFCMYILVFIVLITIGCSRHLKLIPSSDVSEYYVPPVIPDNAYLTAGLEIGEGDIEDIRYALLTLDETGNKSYVSIKGVYLTGTKAVGQKLAIKTPRMPHDYRTSLRETGEDRHAYVTFVLNEDQLSAGGKSLLFFYYASRAEKPGGPSASNSDLQVKSYYWRNGSGAISSSADPLKPIKPSNAPMGFPFGMEDVPIYAVKDASFKGNLFAVDRPGFYYLGDFKVSGYISDMGDVKDLRGKDVRKIRIKWDTAIKNDISRAEEFLKEHASLNTQLQDLSLGVKDRPLSNYLKFREGTLEDKHFYEADRAVQ